jgi:hypothetical protein
MIMLTQQQIRSENEADVSLVVHSYQAPASLTTAPGACSGKCFRRARCFLAVDFDRILAIGRAVDIPAVHRRYLPLSLRSIVLHSIVVNQRTVSVPLQMTVIMIATIEI